MIFEEYVMKIYSICFNFIQNWNKWNNFFFKFFYPQILTYTDTDVLCFQESIIMYSYWTLALNAFIFKKNA